jgi:YqaJ-like viral recombinase domain
MAIERRAVVDREQWLASTALTPAQNELREGKLTGSRIACLMTGDTKAILRLYREFIGEEQEEDLSRVWPVQLGKATEPLNLIWYQMNGNPLSRCGEVVIHPRHDWAAVTLDAWDDVLSCPVECKHVGGREPLEIIVDRYQPQMQWQMEITGAKQCALSGIMGANSPIVEYINADADYAAEEIRRGQQFMACVEARKPPVVLPPVPAPVDASKFYDMTGNNRWADAASIWLATKATARDCADAEKFLKSIVPEDARKVTGYGVQITRDRARRLSLREVA